MLTPSITIIHSLIIYIHNNIYLNGTTSLWYDPYLNRIGTKEDLDPLKHFIVPLIFTQSGTKPMTSIKMSSDYVDYYNNLSKADEICIIGYNFNRDDEHINGLFRDIADYKNIHLTIVTVQGQDSEENVRQSFARKLKLKDDSLISVLFVDSDRNRNGISWIDCLLESMNNKAKQHRRKKQ